MITKKTDLGVWLFHAHGLIEYKGRVTTDMFGAYSREYNMLVSIQKGVGWTWD